MREAPGQSTAELIEAVRRIVRSVHVPYGLRDDAVQAACVRLLRDGPLPEADGEGRLPPRAYRLVRWAALEEVRSSYLCHGKLGRDAERRPALVWGDAGSAAAEALPVPATQLTTLGRVQLSRRVGERCRLLHGYERAAVCASLCGLSASEWARSGGRHHTMASWVWRRLRPKLRTLLAELR